MGRFPITTSILKDFSSEAFCQEAPDTILIIMILMMPAYCMLHIETGIAIESPGWFKFKIIMLLIIKSTIGLPFTSVYSSRSNSSIDD